MSKHIFIESLNQLQYSIDVYIEKQLRIPSLILTYSTIDIMSWLSRPKNRDDAARVDFINWCEKYLLPNSDIKCSSIDIYAARCSIIHSLNTESSLSRKKEARKIYYSWGTATADELQLLIDHIKEENVVAIHMEEFIKDVKMQLKHLKRNVRIILI